MESIIVGVTGASGVVYAQRLLRFLCKREYNIHLAISDAAFLVIRHELSIDLDRHQPDFREFLGFSADNITYYHNSDIGATIASSRYPIKAMVVVPAARTPSVPLPMAFRTTSFNALRELRLKRGRELVVVPRENTVILHSPGGNAAVVICGACVLPAMPDFITDPSL